MDKKNDKEKRHIFYSANKRRAAGLAPVRRKARR